MNKYLEIFVSENRASYPRNFLAEMSDQKPKESILDLGKYLNRPIRMELSGGRKGKLNDYIKVIRLWANWSVSGVLKGYDSLNNMVLDAASEERGNFCFATITSWLYQCRVRESASGAGTFNCAWS